MGLVCRSVCVCICYGRVWFACVPYNRVGNLAVSIFKVINLYCSLVLLLYNTNGGDLFFISVVWFGMVCGYKWDITKMF